MNTERVETSFSTLQANFPPIAMQSQDQGRLGNPAGVTLPL